MIENKTELGKPVAQVPGAIEIADPAERNMQVRPQEIGRFRAGGEHSDPRRPGKPLMAWRVTSQFRDVCESYAERFGGEVKSFDAPLSDDTFQVYTEAAEISLELIEEQHAPFSWAMEQWGQSGVQVRCNQHEKLERVSYKESVKGKAQTLERWEVSPCTCDMEQPVCERRLRVQFLDPELERLGVMRFETGGLTTGNDLIGQYQLGLTMMTRGRQIRAALRLAPTERRVLKTAENLSGRRKYIAAVLDVSLAGKAVRNPQPSLWTPFWVEMGKCGITTKEVHHLLKLAGHDLTQIDPKTGEQTESLNAMGMLPEEIQGIVLALNQKAKAFTEEKKSPAKESLPAKENPTEEERKALSVKWSKLVEDKRF